MSTFAAWIGRLAAAFAALLAVIWMFEAMPPSAEIREQAQASCGRVALEDSQRLLARGDVIGTEAALARYRACQQLGTSWNGDLVTRALLAAGSAALLLMLAAMVPRQR